MVKITNRDNPAKMTVSTVLSLNDIIPPAHPVNRSYNPTHPQRYAAKK
jgi:hypothetical protein